MSLHENIPPIALSAMATTAASPSPNQPRRLSSRRGSVTAPDPHGVHKDVNQNPTRSSTSTLTIVRVTSPVTTPPPTLHEPPSSPVLGARRLQRRLANNPSSPPAPDHPTTNRVSFAFSSFAGSGPAPGGPAAPQRDRSASPSSSPRLRPSSPRLAATTAFPASKPRLTPDQLVELARQSTNPVTLAQQQQQQQHSTPHSGPSSPGVGHSPILRAHSTVAQESIQPATFTPLPDDIYLPFIDRPSEVASLISSPPDVKLFTLLAQTFATTRPLSPDTHISPDLPRDPATWSYAHLIHHLTKIDRDVAPDPIWAMAARKCILSHSELIWERVKGAFGVSPELDVDYDFSADHHPNDESSSSSVHTSDISDDEGRAANGHWSDWDAIMDSPIRTRSKRLSLESASGSIYNKYRGDGPGDSPIAPQNEVDLFRAQVQDRLQGLQEGNPPAMTHPLDIPSTGENTVSPTPAGYMSPPEVFGSFSPPESFISIEPLLASSVSPGSTNPPPLSLPSSLGAAGVSGDGLGDIAEGAEEEEEETETAASTSSNSNNKSPDTPDDSEFISPSQIKGLKISTSPFPATGTPILSPTSPVPQFLAQGPGSGPHSRTSSFSSYVGPFQRSESATNLAAMRAALQTEYAARGGGSSSGYASSDAGDYSDSAYDPVADRAPGNPLFPSNFARLALGPTLKANNPNLRSPPPLPASRYPGRGIRTGQSNPHLAGKPRAYSHSAAGVSGGSPGLATVHSGLREESNLLSTSEAISRVGEAKISSGRSVAPPGEDSALSLTSGSVGVLGE